jgi:dimethylsulfone monooxygenase
MFGHALAEHDRRYEQGLEWFDVMSKIFISKERFDHDGEFYKLNRQLDTNEIFNERKRYAGGRERSWTNWCACRPPASTASFVNFKNELPFFIDRVLPLLRQAGLRQ